MVNKQKTLGQYMTPRDTIERHMKGIDLTRFDTIIEPSFGEGAFLKFFKDNYSDKRIIGVEFDKEIYKEFDGVETHNASFYNIKPELLKNDKVAFVGNPPYHTPAYSLTNNRSFVTEIVKKYNVKGIKEEAVFFILHTFDLLKDVEDFEIHYILPKVMFQNNSKAFKTFRKFLIDNLNLYKVQNIGKDFDNVDQNLVLVSFKKGKQEGKVEIDGKSRPIREFYGQTEDYWDYRKVFNKTSLGSVPAESIFISIEGESLLEFQGRLSNVMRTETSVENLKKILHYKGKYHLRALRSKDKSIVDDKWNTIKSYIDEVKERNLMSLEDIKNIDNFKPFKHRKEFRYYFRLESLKRASFIYILNPNPGNSFYFTANPARNTTDYFGFCEYDVNRNSSPGSIRTVLLKDLEDNISKEFKEYWDSNAKGVGYDRIPDYFIHISKSKWYKDFKEKYHRVYFGLPKKFDEGFLDAL